MDGGFLLGGFVNLTLLSVPRLTSAGSLEIILSQTLGRISAPRLTRITGGVQLGVLVNLTQLDLDRLSSIGGSLSLSGLCKLPWSHAERISTFGTSQNIGYVGCCTMFQRHESCNVGTPPCSCGG